VENSLAFNYRHRKVGDSEWETLSTLDTMAALSDLDECTNYEFELRTVCPQDTSAWLNFPFRTKCSTATNDLLDLNGEFKVYPVPFSTSFTVEYKAVDAGEYRLLLYDLAGRMILQDTYDLFSGQKIIKSYNTVSDFPEGMYVAVLTLDKKRSVRKMIKH
jgi:hypothetical protein